mgnify:CR=1 FL=1
MKSAVHLIFALPGKTLVPPLDPGRSGLPALRCLDLLEHTPRMIPLRSPGSAPCDPLLLALSSIPHLFGSRLLRSLRNFQVLTNRINKIVAHHSAPEKSSKLPGSGPHCLVRESEESGVGAWVLSGVFNLGTRPTGLMAIKNWNSARIFRFFPYFRALLYYSGKGLPKLFCRKTFPPGKFNLLGAKQLRNFTPLAAPPGPPGRQTRPAIK